MTSLRSQAIFIFICGLILFTIGLGSQEIVGFESRFYLFALEMWRHGPTWFPTTYQQPYPDYPATATFMIYIVSKICGGLSKFTAVFPTAVAASVTLAVTYLIGSLHSRKWGVAAVLFLFFTITFVTEARTISTDQYVTAITALCFYLVYSAQLLREFNRVVWIFPLMILGFLFRGPIGLVIPAGVVCVFSLLDRDYKRFITLGILSAILLGICCAVLLAIAKHVGGSALMHEVLQTQVLGRMHSDAQTPSVTFYFIESFGAYAVAYPIAVFILLGLFPQFEFSPSTKMLKKAFGWALVILIGMSIPADKKMRYILPAAPALALICGYLFMVARDREYFHFIRRVFIWFCLLFPLISLITVYFLHHRHPELVFSYQSAMTIFAVLLVIMFLVQRRELFVFGVAVLTFMAATILVMEPINVGLNQTRAFVLQIENQRMRDNEALVFYNQNADGLVIKYLVNAPEEIHPIFVNNIADLSKLKKSTYVIVTEEHYKQIPKKIMKHSHVVSHGYIGREPVIVFQLAQSKPRKVEFVMDDEEQETWS